MAGTRHFDKSGKVAAVPTVIVDDMPADFEDTPLDTEGQEIEFEEESVNVDEELDGEDVDTDDENTDDENIDADDEELDDEEHTDDVLDAVAQAKLEKKRAAEKNRAKRAARVITEKCLNCEKPADGSRHQCKVCYQLSRKLIKDKQVTWEELEAAGLAAEAKKMVNEPSAERVMLTNKLLTARKLTK